MNDRLARVLLAAWALLLVAFTIRPDPGTLTTPGLCIICGERGLADAILNVGLFIPLGLLGRSLGLGIGRLVVIGLCLSGVIETIQFFLPGRDASVGDVAFNGAGGAAGAWLHARLPQLLRPTPRTGARLAVSWAVFALALVWGMAWVLSPRHSEGPHSLRIEPVAPAGGTFEGDVLEVREGPVRRSAGDVMSLDALGGPGDTIRVTFTMPPQRVAFRPLIGLGEAQRPEWQFGPGRTDLTLRIARPIDRFRLTPAHYRLTDALADAGVGDTLVARVWRDGETACLGLGARSACGYAYTVGSAWAFLLPGTWADGARARGLDAAWLALVWLPLGFWFRRTRGVIVASLGLVATLLMVPVVTSLLAALVPTVLGSLAGFVAGLGLARVGPAAYQQIP